MVFHSALILLNLLGWIWRPLQRINLITLLLTGGSWFILGVFYGMGYCPFTDWHFQVLRELGRFPASYSYIEYMLERLLGIQLKAEMVDTWTLTLFFVALAASLFVNIRRWRKKHRSAD